MNQIKRKSSFAGYGLVVATLLLMALALSACGKTTSGNESNATEPVSPTVETPYPTPTNPPGSATATRAITSAPNPSEATGADLAGSGDEPTKAYADPKGQFSFQYPQSWGNTTQTGETIRYTGRDEFISITIVTTNLTPMEFGKADASVLTTASPGFKGDKLQNYKVAAVQGAMISYTWQAGPSPVTGKPVPSSAKRYYIPGSGDKLAIFTYSSPNQNYDPAGADDFANTFRWLQ